MLLPSIFGDDFFDDFMEFPFGAFRRRTQCGVPALAQSFGAMGLMRTDVTENKDSYRVDIDLPGFRKEDVKAKLKDGYLTVTATRESKDDSGDNRFVRRERFMGTVTRSFYVGNQMTEADIKARFEDGILKLTLPKKDEKPAEESCIAIEG